MGFWDRVSRRLDELSEELLPDSIRDDIEEARRLIARGDHATAIVALERALEQKPDHATAHYLLGVAQLRRGEPDKAVANRSKHGLSFETAVLIFDDPFHASKPDPHPDGDRWQTIGLCRTVVVACDSHVAPGRFRSG